MYLCLDEQIISVEFLVTSVKGYLQDHSMPAMNMSHLRFREAGRCTKLLRPTDTRPWCRAIAAHHKRSTHPWGYLHSTPATTRIARVALREHWASTDGGSTRLIDDWNSICIEPLELDSSTVPRAAAWYSYYALQLFSRALRVAVFSAYPNLPALPFENALSPCPKKCNVR